MIRRANEGLVESQVGWLRYWEEDGWLRVMDNWRLP